MTTNPTVSVPDVPHAEAARSTLEAVAALLATSPRVDVTEGDRISFWITPTEVGPFDSRSSDSAIAFRNVAVAWHAELTAVGEWVDAVAVLPDPDPSSTTKDWIECLVAALDNYIANNPDYLKEGTVSFNIKSYAVQPNIDLVIDGEPIKVPIDAAVIPAEEMSAFHGRLTAAMNAKAAEMNSVVSDPPAFRAAADETLTEAQA